MRPITIVNTVVIEWLRNMEDQSVKRIGASKPMFAFSNNNTE
jgi:hypothetical protein